MDQKKCSESALHGDILSRWEAVIVGGNSLLKSHFFDEEKCELSVLDQRLLPAKMEYVQIRSLKDGFEAIKEMKVRGAPLIATVGLLSLLVDLRSSADLNTNSVDQFLDLIDQKCQFLLSARPTAINLSNAFNEFANFLQKERNNAGNVEELKKRIDHFVLRFQSRESTENELLLRNATGEVLRVVSEKKKRKAADKKLVVMTICNTGQLATSSYGTALGVVLVLHRLSLLEMCVALETRPYNQGSRLTAFELQHGGVPFRLIVDNAAASAMRHFDVDAVLVGADQVARNGDTANKIGTCSLAILARHFGIPFFVVTPMASVNERIADGSQIRIEERPAEELTRWNGIAICPPDCTVWNPAFDVTPGELITSILTEKGNFVPSELAGQFGESGTIAKSPAD